MEMRKKQRRKWKKKRENKKIKRSVPILPTCVTGSRNTFFPPRAKSKSIVLSAFPSTRGVPSSPCSLSLSLATPDGGERDRILFKAFLAQIQTQFYGISNSCLEINGCSECWQKYRIYFFPSSSSLFGNALVSGWDFYVKIYGSIFSFLPLFGKKKKNTESDIENEGENTELKLVVWQPVIAYFTFWFSLIYS